MYALRITHYIWKHPEQQVILDSKVQKAVSQLDNLPLPPSFVGMTVHNPPHRPTLSHII